MPVTGLAGLGGGPFGIGGPFGSSVNSMVNAPTILTPANGAIDQAYSLTITASAFDPEGMIDTHVSSDWQLATDLNFVNVVASSIGDTSNLTSWSVSNLEADITHYVRVRYTGESPERVSDWSAVSSFTTLSSFIQAPSILSPTGQLELNPVNLTSSAFLSGGKVTTHVSSDWQIATDSNFSSVVKSTTNDTNNKTSWVPSGSLEQGVTYYARVRYTGGPEALTSDWSAGQSFRMMAVPVIQWVSNTPSSWSPTAGDNRTFNVTATDTANPGGAHNTYSYQWYRNGSPVSGYTGQYFDYYNPVYYSDTGNNFYCRVTITNAAGSASSNSTTCSISVTRNVGCDEVQRLENINFSGAGGKPGSGTNNWCDERYSNNINGVDYRDVCGVAWDIDSFRVRARPGRCPSGYDITLEFKLEGNGINYSKIDKQSAGDGNYAYYGVNTNWMDVNGGNLDGFRFKIIFRAGNQYTQCSDGSQVDIQPEQENNAIGRISIKTRTYRFDSRP